MRGLHKGESCPQKEGGRQHRTVERVRTLNLHYCIATNVLNGADAIHARSQLQWKNGERSTLL